VRAMTSFEKSFVLKYPVHAKASFEQGAQFHSVGSGQRFILRDLRMDFKIERIEFGKREIIDDTGNGVAKLGFDKD
jgi:hypothetical protein